MNRNTRISATALLAIASLAASPSAWSLGLGDATVESYLNQPLRARIDLVTQEADDLASVSAKLASAADYELIGASLDDISVPVRFSVEDEGGDAYLVASSELPLNNPVIRLIVEVNWANGRMLREYTLFLDPPVVADTPAPLPRIDARETVEPAVQTTPVDEPPAATVTEAASAPEPALPEPVVPEPVAQEPARVVQQSYEPTDSEYGPVASGETLWGIAKNWSSGTGMNINKVMIAIQRENPEAFMNNNINLLKRGAILRMPAMDQIESIPSRTAFNEVATQEEEFYQAKGMTPVTSPATPLLSDDRAAEDEYAYPDPTRPEVEPDPVVEPEVETETEPESYADAAEQLVQEAAGADTADEAADAAAEAAESETAPVEEESASIMDQLELVPPSEASELDSTYGFEESEEGGDAVAAQALREDLARTEEELITQQQQNEYLEERIRELESQLQETQDANVADPELAAMEQRLREERQAKQAAEDKPWYAGFGIWLLGLLVLAAAFLGWLFSRRSKGDLEEEAIQEIKDEAEEVLRVLEESPAETLEEAPGDTPEDEEPEDSDGDEPSADEDEADDATVAVPAFGGALEEASVLDEESSDPEIQLDLARAYISMGDKEAARVILEEVSTNGSEEQQAEAQKMLDLM